MVPRMSLTSSVRRPCPECQQPLEVVVHQSLVIGDEATLQSVLENRFHVLECPCGARRPFEVDFLLTNQRRDLLLQVTLDDAHVPEMAEAFRELLPEGPTHARIVESRAAAVEKLRLHTCGLDDVAMEVVKQLVRAQLGDLEGRLQVLFERLDGEQLGLSVHAPGEPVRHVALPRTAHDNAVETFGTAAWSACLEVNEALAGRIVASQRAGRPSGLPEEYRRAALQAATRATGAIWCATERASDSALPFVIERFASHRRPEEHLAVTNGVGAMPGADGQRLELVLRSPKLGPRLVNALAALAQATHDPQRTQPLRDWDVVAFPVPLAGLGGACLRPTWQWRPLGDAVSVWEVVPLTSAELASDPSGRALLVEQLRSRDETSLRERWLQVLGCEGTAPGSSLLGRIEATCRQ